jgi:hypothetical protein
VSFSLSGDTELLAVAQRGGAIAIYEKNRPNDNYGPDPFLRFAGQRRNFSPMALLLSRRITITWRRAIWKLAAFLFTVGSRAPQSALD